ncbi:hypothetical protein DMN91_003282 [Ooceraea biroi]|uniref:Fatty acid synthase n=1 Tax=Ooceraea biroi TaxID=2015173 RepID=A0A3L8DXI7_OOCBI|nr:hypothetical protein DMN91_003282 [Ooceraea biroi]
MDPMSRMLLEHAYEAIVDAGHPYRGYTIIESEASLKPIKEIQQYSGVKQPVCFVFSGIGSQWLGMGTHKCYNID